MKQDSRGNFKTPSCFFYILTQQNNNLGLCKGDRHGCTGRVAALSPAGAPCSPWALKAVSQVLAAQPTLAASKDVP